MILQETYVIYDSIYGDAMSSDTSNNYTKVGGSLTFDTDHLVLTRTADGECYYEIRPTVTDYLGKTIKFECDVNSEQNAQIRIFQYVNGAYQIASSSVSKTGTLTASGTISSSATVLIFRVIGNNLNMSETLESKNFKIYTV